MSQSLYPVSREPHPPYRSSAESHMTKILAKLRANDRTHAVTIALRRGFLDA